MENQVPFSCLIDLILCHLSWIWQHERYNLCYIFEFFLIMMIFFVSSGGNFKPYSKLFDESNQHKWLHLTHSRSGWWDPKASSYQQTWDFQTLISFLFLYWVLLEEKVPSFSTVQSRWRTNVASSFLSKYIKRKKKRRERRKLWKMQACNSPALYFTNQDPSDLAITFSCLFIYNWRSPKHIFLIPASLYNWSDCNPMPWALFHLWSPQ